MKLIIVILACVLLLSATPAVTDTELCAIQSTEEYAKLLVLMEGRVPGCEAGHREMLDTFYIAARGAPDVPVPLMVEIAYGESTWRRGAYNHSTDCAGYLQVRDCHTRTMKRMGLDWCNEQDRCTWAFTTIQASLDKGKTLYQALQPWQPTRKKALYRYSKLWRNQPAN